VDIQPFLGINNVSKLFLMPLRIFLRKYHWTDWVVSAGRDVKSCNRHIQPSGIASTVREGAGHLTKSAMNSRSRGANPPSDEAAMRCTMLVATGELA
jgi:hypothetical protein